MCCLVRYMLDVLLSEVHVGWLLSEVHVGCVA